MPRRLTVRGEARRKALVEYAARLFAQQGYHPTSVAQIVQGMGVGKGVFYWYFSSKEELFQEILREAQLDLRKRQQGAISDITDPVERIEAGIRASMRWLGDHRELLTLFQLAASEERFAGSLRRGQEVAVADVARHVKEGIVAGRIHDVDPTLLSHAILGVINHLARVFIFERGEDPDKVAEAAITFCLQGLTGDRRPEVRRVAP